MDDEELKKLHGIINDRADAYINDQEDSTKREHKRKCTYDLDDGTIRIINAMKHEDGCSAAQVVITAVRLMQHERIILDLMLKNNKLVIGENVVEKELGVYREYVDKCLAMMEKPGKRQETLNLWAVVNDLLEYDNCTRGEREVFTRFISFAKGL